MGQARGLRPIAERRGLRPARTALSPARPVALITGGARGIGAARLVVDGWRVVIADLDPSGAPPGVRPVACDVADEAAVTRADRRPCRARRPPRRPSLQRWHQHPQATRGPILRGVVARSRDQPHQHVPAGPRRRNAAACRTRRRGHSRLHPRAHVGAEHGGPCHYQGRTRPVLSQSRPSVTFGGP